MYDSDIFYREDERLGGIYDDDWALTTDDIKEIYDRIMKDFSKKHCNMELLIYGNYYCEKCMVEGYPGYCYDYLGGLCV